ncbi:farnesyl pyrophosphate synthase 1, mitochondrial-like isoform X2 [Carex rostrata]
MTSELELDEARARFLGLYDRLKNELLQDPVFDLMDEARRYVEQMLDYNIRGGKLNRGFSVIQTYKLLKDGEDLSEEEFFLAGVLGWSIEWLQACLLVLDDIMDNSTTRRGQLCWYKLPKVGSRAINDGVFIKGSIHKMVKRYFREKPYYVDLLELSDEIALQTSFGQMLDLVSSHESERDLSKYNIPAYRRIVQYKTSYYSFYLPIACALLLHGEKLENFTDVKNILIEMGIFFQIQDDFLDCFGDPEVTGKGNYGKADPEYITQVKNVYIELDLENVFFEYELSSYTDLLSSIEALPNPAVQEVLKSLLRKIYGRKR